MHKIVIFNQSYPNPKSGDVGSAFVHVRAKFYKEQFNVEVIKINASEESYNYEGINVVCLRSYGECVEYLKKNMPSVILTHFCEPWMNRVASELNLPIIIWVHGSEAHSWKRILFNVYWGNIIDFIKFIRINLISLSNFKKLINESVASDKIHFVFVSDWMKRITFADTGASTKQYSLVPNPIDTNLFSFKEKHTDLRKKILMIRSFNSSKYANDISMKAILLLSKKTYFNELEFTIYGRGVHWDKLTSKISQFKNVKLVNNLLPQSEIPAIHSQNGIFLCPTRMDAQGVSMCEAMSGGLIPVTSNNTAIPEFVKNNESGFLTNSAREIAGRIEFLYNNPLQFAKMSKAASEKIKATCSMSVVIEKEIELINNMIEKNKSK